MKTSTYRIIGLALLLFWAMIPLQAYAEDQDFAKVIEKSFDISANGKVELSNIYGNMAIKTWNKNKVDIRVTLEVSAKSEKAAEKIFEKIKIEFENSNDWVSAITNIDGGGFSWGSGSKVTINYLVNMPETCLLHASNKYGNLDLEALKGDASLEVSYGGLHTESISGNTNLLFAYSKGSMKTLNAFQAEIKYSELSVEQSGNTNIESKYSQLNIKKAGKVEIESKYASFTFGEVDEIVNEGKYDRFSIGTLGSLNQESSYTDISVEKLVSSFDAELKFGNILIEEVLKGFDKISIESQYVDVNMGIGENTSVDLDLHGSYINVNLPSEFRTASDNKEDHKERHVSGQMGPSSGGKISVSMEFGNFKLK